MPSKAIYHFEANESEQIFAWARYVFWADVECRQYEAHEPAKEEPVFGLSLVLMIQWYAALWVAIEGWRACPLSDATIDELLTHAAFNRNIELLRRLRNGVYHYQQDLINERLLAFLRECEHTVPWAFLLHSEFKRVLWQVAHPQGVASNIQEEMAEVIQGIVGWLPSDIAEAAPHDAARRHREAAEMILKGGSRDTQHASDLLDAVKHLRSTAHQAEADWTKRKRALIESLKEQKRDS